MAAMCSIPMAQHLTQSKGELCSSRKVTDIWPLHMLYLPLAMQLWRESLRLSRTRAERVFCGRAVF